MHNLTSSVICYQIKMMTFLKFNKIKTWGRELLGTQMSFAIFMYCVRTYSGCYFTDSAFNFYPDFAIKNLSIQLIFKHSMPCFSNQHSKTRKKKQWRERNKKWRNAWKEYWVLVKEEIASGLEEFFHLCYFVQWIKLESLFILTKAIHHQNKKAESLRTELSMSSK